MGTEMSPMGGGLPSIPELFSTIMPSKKTEITVDTGLFTGWFREKRTERVARVKKAEADIELYKAEAMESIAKQMITALTFGERFETEKKRYIHERHMMDAELVTAQANAKTAVSKAMEAEYNARITRIDYLYRAKDAKEQGLDFED